jgi:hypothetical protein
MMSLPLWRYILTAVARDRIVQLMIVMMALGTAASIFLGSAAVTEQQAFTIATVATALRTLAVLGLVIFISFFVRRVFESREIDYLLATPLTRHRLLMSFAAAFITVAIVFAVMIAVIVLILQRQVTGGWMMWSASVVVELSITCMIALFFSIVLKSATVSALCSLGYYTLARMLGAMIGISATKFDAGSTFVNMLVNWVIRIISVVTPRFDLLAQSAWLVYGKAEGIAPWLMPVQLVVFCMLFFFCAAFDLRRSQF